MICETDFDVYCFAVWCLAIGLVMGYALWGIKDDTRSKQYNPKYNTSEYTKSLSKQIKNSRQ